MTTSDIKNFTDGELITHYKKHRGSSDLAMRELVGRHHDNLHGRFMVKVKDESIAKQLQSELWIRVTQSMSRYKEEGKFAHYLSRLHSNIVIDYYRKSGLEKEVMQPMPASSSQDENDDDGNWAMDNMESAEANPEQQHGDNELVKHLSSVLVPQLPVEQRAAWLLRHESEFWEPGKRFEWQHLAELNNMSEEDVWATFEKARHKLMATKPNAGAKLEEIELLIFLVWTQAQRLDKSENYTWEYFSELLDQPVNTMKTRYRTALQTLNSGLTEYMQS